MKRLAKLLTLTMIVVMGSCSFFSAEKRVTIEDVSWSIETIAPDYWVNSIVDKISLSYSFEVFFKESLDVNDIKSARIYLPNSSSYWILDPETTLDPDRHSIGYGTRYWLTSNNDELPIGTLTAEIILENGNNSQYTFIMGQPGSTSPGIYNFVYSSQDEATPRYPATSIPALMRPDAISTWVEHGKLNTQFRIRGDNVRNGWIWYYDSSGYYMGRSPYFYNQKTGADTATFSKGYFDPAANAENHLICTPSEIVKSDGSLLTTSEMGQIAHFRVIVTDGAQYSGQGVVQYDYRAMSSYF